VRAVEQEEGDGLKPAALRVAGSTVAATPFLLDQNKGYVASNNPQLRPELAQAEQKLERALNDACDSDVKKADTGELIRIEQSLALANAAAREVISVRRRLREERVEELRVRESHRKFDDAHGVRWDAFAVHPSVATAGRGALPDPYQAGWLSFDSGKETRRLAPIPDGWKDLSDDGLRRLLDKAEAAPQRKRRDS
jgi:hypothetical protein